jgi:hypothetical protein
MRRNTFRRVLDEAQRVAQRQALTPAQASAPTSGSGTGVDVGVLDTTTGDWVAFGLLDITPLGEFRTA